MSDGAAARSPVKKVAKWVAAQIRLLLGRKALPPLPAGATLDPAFAEAIAQDAAKLDAARAYWQQQLTTQSGTPDFFDSPAGKLSIEASATPSSVVSGPRNALRGRAQYLLSDGKKNIVRDELAPLLSLGEIAKHVAETMPRPIAATSAEVLRQDVAALLSGPVGQPAGDAAVVGRGLRSARELVDVARRMRFASSHYTAHLGDIPGASFAEPLSLHWNEGAFAVAPSWDSFAAAPLIFAIPALTRGGDEHDLTGYGYRTASVFLGKSGALRPGYIPYYPWKSEWAGPADARFNLAHMNLMTLGGLDNVLVWYPQLTGANRDHTTNELWALLSAHYARNGWVAFNSRPAYGFCLAEIEASAGSPPVAGLQGGINRLNAMHAALAPVAVPTGAGAPKYAALRALDDARITSDALSVATSWYRSRRMVRSLVAWRDRGAPQLAGAFLTPYLAYLRYHQGDVLFVRTVLSTLKALPELQTAWDRLLRRPSARAKVDTAGANLLAILEQSGWAAAADRDALVQSAGGWLASWHSSTVAYRPWGRPLPTETAWRHVGLVNAMRAAAPADPLLASMPAVAVNPALAQVADVANQCVQAITSMALWRAVDCALQYTPIQTLLDKGVHSSSKGSGRRGPREFVAQLSKAENFERRRLYYEHLRQLAGLGPDAK